MKRARAVRTNLIWIGALLPGLFLASTALRAQDVHSSGNEQFSRGQFAGGQMVRGTVTATTAEQLTVKTEAGETYQVAISANTRLRKDGQPVKAADVKVGDNLGAMGVLDAATKTVHAMFVVVVDAEQARKMRENLGKTYIAGRVTAIDMDALKITVMRPDNVSQTIAVDEGTSFRRGGRGMQSMMSGSGPVESAPPAEGAAGGESITLADIKVGDSVAGRGALKNGVFVAKELGIGEPGMRRRRQSGSEAARPGGSSSMPQPQSSGGSPR